MSNATKVWTGMIGAFAIALVAIVFALFHGYFDHGRFEIMDAAWSPSGPARVAIVAKRSDHDARSGDQYFVIVGDHLFSPVELRKAYYSDSVIFASDGSCLSAHWGDTNSLTLLCREGSVHIEGSHIAVQLRQIGDLSINYVSIPDMTRR